jgi:hypothetical protein
MFTLISVSDPVYTSNTPNSGINVTIQLAEFSNPIKFHAMQNDPEPHGVQIYNDLIAGKYGPIAPYVPPAPAANNQPVSSGTTTV